MKKYAYFALTLVLTAALLVGCGCTNRKMDNATTPTVLPTNEEVWETTRATTHATTEATTNPTVTDSTRETIDNGNGPLEDSTVTTEATMEGRARNGMTNGR